MLKTHMFLKLIGVARAERRRLGVTAAERDLNVRDRRICETGDRIVDMCLTI